MQTELYLFAHATKSDFLTKSPAKNRLACVLLSQDDRKRTSFKSRLQGIVRKPIPMCPPPLAFLVNFVR